MVFFYCCCQDNASPDEQIQMQLVSVPMYGILTRSQSQQEHQELREYSSFTMDDINKLTIRFDVLHCSPCCQFWSFVRQTGDRRNSSNLI